MNARLRLGREAHVFGDAEPGKEVGELKRAPQAEPGALGRAQAGDVLALEEERPIRGGKLPRHQVEIGGLAGAVRPHNGGKLARKESAGDVIDRHMAAEADGKPPRLQRRRHRLLRIGISISSILSSRVISGMPQATFGSTLILKAYIDCSA